MSSFVIFGLAAMVGLISLAEDDRRKSRWEQACSLVLFLAAIIVLRLSNGPLR